MNHEFGNIGRRLPYDLPEHRLEALHERILRNTEGADDPNLRVSAEESGAPILLISQFTLYADVRKGRRPGWSHAAPGPVAEPIVADVAAELRTT